MNTLKSLFIFATLGLIFYTNILSKDKEEWYNNLLNNSNEKIGKELYKFDYNLLFNSINQIKENKFDELFEQSSYLFKENIVKNDFISHVRFLNSVNGSLKSYQLSNAAIQDSITIFIFDTKYTELNTNVILQLIYVSSITKSGKAETKLAGFNLHNEDYIEIPKLSIIAKPFIDNFKNNNIEEIYENSSQIYRDNVSIEQLFEMYNSIIELGKIDEIKYYNYTFAVEPDGDVLSLIYVLHINNSKYKLILSYIMENGVYKLMRIRS